MNYPNDFLNKIINGDCLEIMAQIPDKSVDLILCDLPYGVTARNKWDCIIPYDKLWAQYKRIAKETTPIVLTAIQPFTSFLVTSNPEMFKYEWIWRKQMGTGFLNANKQPLRNHESVLVFYSKQPLYNPQKWQGKPYKMTRRGDTSNYGEVKELHFTSESVDGLRFPLTVQEFNYDKSKLHPTQKPLALFEYMIKTYTTEGMTVLDNCAGSFTTAIAAENTKRNWICIELEKNFCEIGQKRLDENRTKKLIETTEGPNVVEGVVITG